MGEVVTVGLDIAKSVFQVHGVDAAGDVIVRRQVRRAQLLQYFAKLPAWSGSRRARRPTIGPASSAHWATRSG
jgi:transposase